MFLKAGLLSMALLVASRLLGLARESAQAAAFGTTGLGDVAVLMLTLPDWLAGLLAGGALAYVLLPHWAQQPSAGRSASQRAVARTLVALGCVLSLAIWGAREPLVALLAAGLAPAMRPLAAQALGWSALALPAALLAALWATRLQHERDFTGMYGANLVVNGVLVVALILIAESGYSTLGIANLGWFFLLAMGLRLLWLQVRLRGTGRAVGLTRSPMPRPTPEAAAKGAMPGAPVWIWAVLSAGLPLALPFAARSMASSGGEGALATFNFAWKLVELPLVLAIQLVATLAFPAITRAFAGDSGTHDARFDGGTQEQGAQAVRGAFALAWTLACAAVAGLLLGAPALAQLLFGWGRMSPEALARVSDWGAIGAWGLLPQALAAVGLTVLATQGRMRWAAGAYAAALGLLFAAAGWAAGDGARLMAVLNGAFAAVAVLVLAALGRGVWAWLPVRLMAVTSAALLALLAVRGAGWVPDAALQGVPGLALAGLAAAALFALGWMAGPELKRALRR